MIPRLFMVIPCYNEEEVLPLTAELFLNKLKDLIEKEKIAPDSRILFVNDGSKDQTWKKIQELSEKDEHFIGISQSRNRGHQNAVLAGLMESKDRCDITVSIDCDGQDDVSVMEEMVDVYRNGFEIVYGVRSSRETDTFFKRVTAEGFYKLLQWMGVECVYNHADYRLISSRALQELAKFHEVNLFLRGMVPLVGFRSANVYYERRVRIAGESHYPLRKMVALAFDGITSLSTKPLHLITGTGFLVSVLSFIGVIWSVISVFVGNTVPGWGSIVSILCFLSGIQLISLGILGEYIGKIYMETKHRPRYIISDRTEGIKESKKREEKSKLVRKKRVGLEQEKVKPLKPKQAELEQPEQKQAERKQPGQRQAEQNDFELKPLKKKQIKQRLPEVRQPEQKAPESRQPKQKSEEKKKKIKQRPAVAGSEAASTLDRDTEENQKPSEQALQQGSFDEAAEAFLKSLEEQDEELSEILEPIQQLTARIETK